MVTPSDMTAVNALMAHMNSHMKAQATARGYAYVDISVVYDPNAAGQAILAQAAASAIATTYHVTIP